MKPGLLLLFAFAFASIAAAPDRPEVQAKLLDQNEYLCSNCFVGPSTYFYCFQADNKILIGYHKAPTFNWKDPKRNNLAKVRKGWAGWVPEADTVPLRYDDKFIWVKRPDGKQIKLKQDYSKDVFVNNRQCRAAVTKNNP